MSAVSQAVSRCDDTEVLANSNDDIDLRHNDATDESSISPRCRVLIASAVAAVGGVLFGYDSGQ